MEPLFDKDRIQKRLDYLNSLSEEERNKLREEAMKEPIWQEYEKNLRKYPLTPDDMNSNKLI